MAPPSPEVLALSRHDKAPGWTAREVFIKMLEAALEVVDSGGRAIVFFHYAGHSAQGVNGLQFTSPSSSKAINFCNILGVVGAKSDLDDNTPIDVVFILDCCYSFTFTKSAKPIGRVVEILAAVDSITPDKRMSFTRKLAEQVAFLKNQHHQSIELAELVATLRANSLLEKPAHAIIVGSSSVRLYFSGIIEPQLAPQSLYCTLQAIFKVHIDGSFTPEELENFISWIHSLSPRAGLGLEAVYETTTTSMCLIVRGSCATFSKLNGIPGLSLICETSSGNLLKTGSAKRRRVEDS